MPRKSSPGIPIALAQAPEFRRRLLRWFRRHGRDLPWRRTRDPYRVLVSEFMLQQTQVSRVEAYYHRFLDRYPSVESLAAAAARGGAGGMGRTGLLPAGGKPAPVGPAGGRRARRASFPPTRPCCSACRASDDTPPGRWRALPTSARRRRWIPTSQGFSGGPSIRGCGGVGPAELWATGAALVPRAGKRAWEFNQAIMELGALICTARVARCGECPVRESCRTGQEETGNGERGTGRGNRVDPVTAFTAQNGGCSTTDIFAPGKRPVRSPSKCCDCRELPGDLTPQPCLPSCSAPR